MNRPALLTQRKFQNAHAVLTKTAYFLDEVIDQNRQKTIQLEFHKVTPLSMFRDKRY